MAPNNPNNQFHVYGSNDKLADFLKSSIESSEEVLTHYDFVIKDVSSQISNPSLEATKDPVLKFLQAMRHEWEVFQSTMKQNLDDINSKS